MLSIGGEGVRCLEVKKQEAQQQYILPSSSAIINATVLQKHHKNYFFSETEVLQLSSHFTNIKLCTDCIN